MEEKLRKCKYCGSDIKVKTGLGNWKNLFRKPTLDDWIMLFIILMMFSSAYAYKTDIKNIINYYEDENYCRGILLQENPSIDYLGLDNRFYLGNNSKIKYNSS